MKFTAGLLCLFAAVLAPTARASTITATITGNVFSGQNGYGGSALVFGTLGNLSGDIFTLTFTFDDSKGSSTGSSCSNGGMQNSYTAGSSSTTNPGTATLTITHSDGTGGGTFAFGGGGFGETAIASDASKYYSGNGCGLSNAMEYYVTVSYGALNYSGSSGVTADLSPSTGYIGTDGDWRRQIFAATNLSSTTFSFSIDIAYNSSLYQYAYGSLVATGLSIDGVPCNLPISETSTAVGWGNGIGTTLAKYNVTLNDLFGLTSSFNGTDNLQEFVGATGTDTCWDADPNNGVTGQYLSFIPGGPSSAGEAGNNQYGPDYIGLPTAGIEEYTLYAITSPNPSSCALTWHQQMKYYCSETSTWYAYGSTDHGNNNTLVTTITAPTLFSQRGNASENKTNPY